MTNIGTAFLLQVLGFCVLGLFSAAAQQTGRGAHYESHIAGRPRVIIFVHGFTGTADDSWRAQNGGNLPTLLATDDRVKQANVFVASYDTHWRNENSTIALLAGRVYKQLSDLAVLGEHKELIFVCHSLGGLVVERLLIDHPDIGAKTAFIQFYGTPHEGVLSPTTNLLLGFLKLLGENSLVPELRAGSGNEVLVQLDKDWKSRQFSGIHRFCAIEIRRTYLSHVPM
jgi:pimeloyl-ACP methyl ester carboxylesterase